MNLTKTINDIEYSLEQNRNLIQDLKQKCSTSGKHVAAICVYVPDLVRLLNCIESVKELVRVFKVDNDEIKVDESKDYRE